LTRLDTSQGYAGEADVELLRDPRWDGVTALGTVGATVVTVIALVLARLAFPQSVEFK